MNFNGILMMLSIGITMSPCQRIPPNAVSSIIQEILSPRTAEKAREYIRSTGGTNRKLAVSEMPLRKLAISEMPVRKVAISDMPLRKITIIEPMPKTVLLQTSPSASPRLLLQQSPDMPRMILQKSGEVHRVLPEMQTKFPMIVKQSRSIDYVMGNEKSYFNPVNPFLPAASPVSAMAPTTSSLLPPVLPTPKGQYLRKIPIPPPSL